MKQKTIHSSIRCSGIGIHSGQEVNLSINPAPADHGIIFIRTDLKSHNRIPAIWENIKSGINASTLGVNGTRIGTVEHLLAALAGVGVDNAEVRLDGPEVPILDGSAGPFVQMLNSVGIEPLDAVRPWLVVKKPLRVQINGSFSEIKPAPRTSIRCSISYNHPLLQSQEMTSGASREEFINEIAGARTFGFLRDVERLKENGLALGGSLDNAIVFDEAGVLNEEGMRWDDECVRHKILDLIGDLSLAGAPIIGEVVSHKGGHSLNHLLLRELLTSPEHYELVERPI